MIRSLSDDKRSICNVVALTSYVNVPILIEVFEDGPALGQPDPSIGPARRIGWQPLPAMPPYFCQLNQYCCHWRRELGAAGALPPKPENCISGAPHHQQTR